MSKFTAALNEQVGASSPHRSSTLLSQSLRRADAASACRTLLPAGGRRAKPRDDDRAVPARCGRAGDDPGVAAPQSASRTSGRRSSWRWAKRRRSPSRSPGSSSSPARKYEHVGEQFLGWFLASNGKKSPAWPSCSPSSTAPAPRTCCSSRTTSPVSARAPLNRRAPPRQQPEAPFSVALAPLSYSARDDRSASGPVQCDRCWIRRGQ